MNLWHRETTRSDRGSQRARGHGVGPCALSPNSPHKTRPRSAASLRDSRLQDLRNRLIQDSPSVEHLADCVDSRPAFCKTNYFLCTTIPCTIPATADRRMERLPVRHHTTYGATSPGALSTSHRSHGSLWRDEDASLSSLPKLPSIPARIAWRHDSKNADAAVASASQIAHPHRPHPHNVAHKQNTKQHRPTPFASHPTPLLATLRENQIR